jgi:hypothetical protein
MTTKSAIVDLIRSVRKVGERWSTLVST